MALSFEFELYRDLSKEGGDGIFLDKSKEVHMKGLAMLYSATNRDNMSSTMIKVKNNTHDTWLLRSINSTCHYSRHLLSHVASSVNINYDQSDYPLKQGFLS